MLHTTHLAQRTGRTLATLALSLTVGVTLLLGMASFNPAHAATTTISVDKASRAGRCSDARDRTSVTPASPLCSLTRAAALARAGDTVMVRAATYTETLRPLRSGTASAPIRFAAAEAGVTIDAGGRAAGILVSDRTDLRFSGFTVKAARSQGIWVSGSARVVFDKLVVRQNGVGMQLKASSDVTVQRSTLSANLSAGIMELGGVLRGHYLHDHITGNGHDGQPYNGDGLQLRGRKAVVSHCDITGNGDHSLYEHGIYASTQATGYVIQSNRLSGNSATNVKAQGSGTVRYNLVGGARLGIYLDHNSAPGVSLYYNVLTGTFEHALQTGTGALLSMLNNTVNLLPVALPGDHAAVLVAHATKVTLRNNIISNQNPSAAIAVGADVPAKALRAGNNRYASADPARVAAWHSRSLSLPGWRTATRVDASSKVVRTPGLDRKGKILSPSKWRPLGQRLNLRRDFAGRALPRKGQPTVGARQR
jgi:hypothetical protein